MVRAVLPSKQVQDYARNARWYEEPIFKNGLLHIPKIQIPEEF